MARLRSAHRVSYSLYTDSGFQRESHSCFGTVVEQEGQQGALGLRTCCCFAFLADFCLLPVVGSKMSSIIGECNDNISNGRIGDTVEMLP